MTKHAGLVIFVCTLWTPSVAVADILEGRPAQIATVPGDESGAAETAVTFDMSGLRLGLGLEVTEAFIEFTVEDLSADGGTFQLSEILNSWDERSLGSAGRGAPSAEWDLAPLDVERIGGLVKLDAKSLVSKGVKDPNKNFGVVIGANNTTTNSLTKALSQGRLVVRYGFSGDREVKVTID